MHNHTHEEEDMHGHHHAELGEILSVDFLGKAGITFGSLFGISTIGHYFKESVSNPLFKETGALLEYGGKFGYSQGLVEVVIEPIAFSVIGHGAALLLHLASRGTALSSYYILGEKFTNEASIVLAETGTVISNFFEPVIEFFEPATNAFNSLFDNSYVKSFNKYSPFSAQELTIGLAIGLGLKGAAYMQGSDGSAATILEYAAAFPKKIEKLLKIDHSHDGHSHASDGTFIGDNYDSFLEFFGIITVPLHLIMVGKPALEYIASGFDVHSLAEVSQDALNVIGLEPVEYHD